MKLLSHIENADQLKKEGWKQGGNFSGAQGTTTKWQKEKDGVKQTVYNKHNEVPIRSFPGTQFKTTSKLTQLLAELSARDIAEAINKAGKTYGYPVAIFPIPLDAQWSIDYLEKEKALDIHFTSSAFNNGGTGWKLPEKKFAEDDTIVRRVWPINVLIGNYDDHRGNRIYNNKKKSFYSIDFGLAFGDKYTKDKEGTLNELTYTVEHMLQKAQTDKQKQRVKQKFANFYNFLELFLEHNENYMVNTLEKNYKLIGKKIALAAKDVDEETENNIMHTLGMLEKTKDEKQKVLRDSIKLMLEACKRVQEIIK